MARSRTILTAAREREIAIRAKAGDSEALGILLDSVRPLLYKWAKRIIFCMPLSEEDDLVNEAMVQIAERIRYYDPDSGTRFSTYVGWCKRSMVELANSNGIIKPNRLYLAIRRHEDDILRKQKVLSLNIPDENGEEQQDNLTYEGRTSIDHFEDRDFVEACLKWIPSKYAVFIRLRYLDGWSMESIAEEFGCTKQNISYMMHRGLRAIRQRAIADHAPPQGESAP